MLKQEADSNLAIIRAAMIMRILPPFFTID